MAGKRDTASITLNEANPNIGDGVTFTLTQDQTEFPWVEVLVANPNDDKHLYYGQVQGYFPAANPVPFQLGPTPSWQSGPGKGTATAFESTRNNRRKIIATVEFDVTG